MTEEELKMLTMQKVYGLRFLKEAKEMGLVDEEYVQNYVKRSLAEIEGIVMEEPVNTPMPALPSKSNGVNKKFFPASAYLAEMGLDADTINRFGSRYGRRIREKYIERNGDEPRKSAPGCRTGACLYMSGDRPLLHEVYLEMFGGP